MECAQGKTAQLERMNSELAAEVEKLQCVEHDLNNELMTCKADCANC